MTQNRFGYNVTQLVHCIHSLFVERLPVSEFMVTMDDRYPVGDVRADARFGNTIGSANNKMKQSQKKIEMVCPERGVFLLVCRESDSVA